MRLKDLLLEGALRSREVLDPCGNTEVRGISSDSRSVRQGDLFFAITGATFDAKKIIPDVVERGVVAVVYDGDLPDGIDDSRSLIAVHDVREALSYAAHRFYQTPSLTTTNIAITGTSGKTSVSWFLSHALHLLGQRTFLGGTLGYTLLSDGESPTEGMSELGNTSIDPISVQRLLRTAVEQGAQNAVFEATSQGVVQKRMRYVAWNGAVFTNLSRDHLDLHETMDAYEEAKAQLFVSDLNASPKENPFAIINGDDPAGARLARRIASECPRIKVVVYSAQRDTTATAIITALSATQTGVSCEITVDGQHISIQSPSIGTHSAYNLVSAALVLHELGFTDKDISSVLAKVPSVPGRLEYIEGGPVPVYIDYAHKPDALQKILAFLKPLVPDGRLICVFGCGGDRDTGKRPIMGDIASSLADFSIITSDNPRTEDPQKIIADIVSGVPLEARAHTVIEIDRTKAIEKAIVMAEPGDVVLIAGKGHEPYQEIQGIKHPFHDGEIARQSFLLRNPE